MEETLTPAERGIIAVVRLNEATKREYVIDKRWSFGGWGFHLTWRDKHNAWGRFGGGWNWELGFQISGGTIIVNLLVMALRISREEKKNP